jgi:hypothetical protein
LEGLFCFFQLNISKERWKRGGKSWERDKEEQRGLFLKEIVKKSRDAEKKRNEINKEEGYKKQVFIFDS